MKHILRCSFGKDSIATALLALQHGEPLDELVYCEVMFSEKISGELPEHSRFIHETAIPYFEQRGIPTRVLRSEKTYLSCFYHVVTRGRMKGRLSGCPLSAHCALQRDSTPAPIRAHHNPLPPDTMQYIGIAADEPKRLTRLNGNKTSLLDKYHMTEAEARTMCEAEGLLSPLYEFSRRGGCWFCPNASVSELRHLYYHHPDLWKRLLELQDVPNKTTERFSWQRTVREIDERFRLEGEQLSFYEDRRTMDEQKKPRAWVYARIPGDYDGTMNSFKVCSMQALRDGCDIVGGSTDEHGGWLLRPGYREMRQQVKVGTVDCIYICRMRQVSGKERHLYSFFRRLMQHGVQITATEYSLRDRVNMFRLARRVERYATRKGLRLPW